MKFDINYTFDALPRLLEGASVTLQVALLGFLFSVTLGTTIVLIRNILNWRILNVIIAIYVSFIRGTPIMIQIFLIYYVVMWFLDLPEPSMEQSGLISILVGAGAAWFGLYVNSAAKEHDSDNNKN